MGHASKKYDGFVPKAINRMDTTGKLPTPSRSENQSNLSFSYEIEQQKRKSADQHNYAISQLKQFQKEYQQETYSRNTQKPIGLPPRLYADDGLQRDRGFTNESNISGSQSMSNV